MHKLTKPFLNEVTWYLELLKQVSLVEKQLPADLGREELCLAQQCPVVYHAHSNYYSGEATQTCSGCPWFCSLPLRQAEEGILVMEVTASLPGLNRAINCFILECQEERVRHVRQDENLASGPLFARHDQLGTFPR